MSAFFTFDINPSTTIKFAAPIPDPAANNSSLVIITPDSVTITIAEIDAFSSTVDWDFNNPGNEASITVSDINAGITGGSAAASNASGALTALPWTEFPPGRYQVTYDPISTAELSSNFLQFTTVDDCLYTKTNEFTYQVCCTTCDTELRDALTKLIILKEGANQDFANAAYTDMDEKITLMEHICESTSCSCGCS